MRVRYTATMRWRWLVGPLVAKATLFILGIGLLLFASGGGLLLAAVIAFIAGTAAACRVDSRTDVAALIVAVSIAASLWAYTKAVESRPLSPGTSHGGPNVAPPESDR